MRGVLRWWGALALMIVVLTSCAGVPEQSSPVRQALVSLSDRAAEVVTEAPDWERRPFEMTLLLATPEVDERLGIEVERFREHLSRALLAQGDGPQVLDLLSGMDNPGASGQWRLDSHLAADGPRLRLSDRELLPYRLTLRLRRAGDDEPRWQYELSGAIDVSAL